MADTSANGAGAAPEDRDGSWKARYPTVVSYVRAPRGRLRPFVKLLWFADAGDPAPDNAREHVLPTGSMHIALRLDDEPVRVWSELGQSFDFGTAVIGGIRAGFYVKEVGPARSVGAQLHAAACLPLLGVPAEELAERHTRLDEVWGAATASLRERLREARSPDAALTCFEAELEARLPRVRGVHPAIAHALARFDELRDVADVVEDTGLSHRRFLTLFREAVGLAPKRYCRVLRFQRALAGVAAGEPLGVVAIDAGYSDQAHLTREFRELAGVSPGAYRAIAPEFGHHVRFAGSDSFKTSRGARPTLST
jgi:AraC-like DNA-binding protein